MSGLLVVVEWIEKNNQALFFVTNMRQVLNSKEWLKPILCDFFSFTPIIFTYFINTVSLHTITAVFAYVCDLAFKIFYNLSLSIFLCVSLFVCKTRLLIRAPKPHEILRICVFVCGCIFFCHQRRTYILKSL